MHPIFALFKIRS
jgi:hypothetical protein